MKENYTIIENENTLILGNFAKTQMMTDKPADSLSFGVLDKVHLGDQYRIDYYGDDEEDCVCHAINHIKHIVKKCHGNQVLLSISLTQSAMDINQLNSSLPEGIGELKRDTYFNHEAGKGMWVFQTNLDILR